MIPWWQLLRYEPFLLRVHEVIDSSSTSQRYICYLHEQAGSLHGMVSWVAWIYTDAAAGQQWILKKAACSAHCVLKEVWLFGDIWLPNCTHTCFKKHKI